MTSQKTIKENNTKRVFNLVRKNRGTSRAEIAGKSGLSPTTVSSLVDELIVQGLIVESGPADISTIGRKPIMLEINPGGGFFVCADLRKKGYNLGLFNLESKPEIEEFIPLENYDELGTSLSKNIDNILKKRGYEKNRMFGICIGAPGIIDRKKKRILSSTVLPVNESNNFMDMLEKRYPEIFIEVVNESSLSAYAEKEYMKSPDSDNLIYIDIHEGIGAGIIINGDIYEGSGYLAGEFGHISVDVNGPVCGCGARGCLEVLANIPALIETVEKTNPGGDYPMDKDENEKFDYIRSEYISDKRFLVEIEKQAEYVAYGINNAINLLDPGIVVIGGTAGRLGKDFLDAVVKIQKKIGLGENRKTKILLSEFMGNPVTSGGARYILNSIF